LFPLTLVQFPPGALLVTECENGQVAAELESKGILVTAKDRHGVTGLRVACHIYNTTAECDVFVASLAEIRDRRTGAAPKL
jgi:selenocysteine lyase/cysteine desulfurase